ncbi:MAG: L,D-transpeptidase family protein [Gammaproteobacteria bacterium]
MRRKYLFIFAVVAALPAHASNAIWLLVDTRTQKMEVKDGERTVDVFEHIAIGRGGAGFKQRRGDNITPIGTYRIGWINDKSSFHRFFGLNYPDANSAHRGLARGEVSYRDFYNVVSAHRHNAIPPQNTPLGGRIGIHGLGAGDLSVHQNFNWTHGCIALTNKEIDRLAQWIDEGTVVKIK